MGTITVYFIALAIALAFKRKISETAVTSIMMVTVIIYAFGIFGNLPAGFYTAVAVNVAAVVFCVIKLIADRKSVVRSVLDPASIAWILFMLFFGYFSLGRGFVDTDDQLTWGLYVKELCIYNSFFDKSFANLLYDHPHLTAVWQYFANKTWLGFSEGVTLWSYDVYTVSAVLPLFDRVKGRNRIYKGASLFISLLILSFMTYGNAYSRLSANILTAFLLFWGFYCVYQLSRRYELYYVVVSLLDVFCITLTIRAGMFCGFGIIAYLTYVLVSKKYRGKIITSLMITAGVLSGSISYYSQSRDFKGLFVYAAAAIAGLAVYGLQKLTAKYGKHFLTIPVLFIAIGLVLIISYLTKHYDDGDTTIYLFFDHIFTTSQGSAFNLIPISLSAFLLLLLAALYLFRRYQKKQGGQMDKAVEILWAFVYLLIFELLCAYLISYTLYIKIEPSMNRLPSFPRYMTPCYLLPILWIIYLALPDLDKQFGNLAWVGLLLVSMLISDPSQLANYMLIKYKQPEYHAFEDAGVQLTADDKIFYINLDGNLFEFTNISFYYAMAPATSNFYRAYADSTNDLTITGAESGDDFCEKLHDLGYDYVYLQSGNSEFFQNYSQCFETDGEIKTGAAYRLVEEDGEYKLRLLGQ